MSKGNVFNDKRKNSGHKVGGRSGKSAPGGSLGPDVGLVDGSAIGPGIRDAHSKPFTCCYDRLRPQMLLSRMGGRKPAWDTPVENHGCDIILCVCAPPFLFTPEVSISGAPLPSGPLSAWLSAFEPRCDLQQHRPRAAIRFAKIHGADGSVLLCPPSGAALTSLAFDS